MSNSARANRRGTRLLVSLAASGSLLAGCGLAMDDADRLARATSAFEAGEYRAAVIDTRTVLQHQPDNREARLLLGRAALSLNDVSTAEKELRRAVSLGTPLPSVAIELGRAMIGLRQYEALLEELVPELGTTEEDRLSILRLRGDALAALDRTTEARQVYQQVLQAEPEDLPALLGVARSQAAEAAWTDARATLERLLAIGPDYVPARIVSASLFLSSQDPAAAEAEFAKAAQLAAAQGDAAEQIAALSGLIEAQLARQDLAGAKQSLARLETLAADNLATRYLAARIAFLEQDYDRAQDELQKVLAAAPHSEPAQFLMGAVQLQRGSLAQAEMHLSAVLGSARFSADARKLLAEVRLRQDRADEAADLLQPLLQGEDSDVGALNLAVRASLEAGNVDNAIDYLRRALANDPDNTTIQLDLAAALMAVGEIDEAEALLSETVTGDENAYRRALLGVLVPLRRGDATTALDEANAMAERWPADARVRNLTGGIALSLENPELARRSFLAARDLDPKDLTAYLNLAKLDIDSGDYDAARRHYEQALEHQPGSVPLMVALGQLEARSGNAEAAVEWLEQARRVRADALVPRMLLARYYLGERDYQAAEAVASEAVRIAGSDPQAHNLLGLARQGRGEVSAAVESFDEAGRLDPDEADYRLNKARAQAALGEVARAEETLLGAGSVDGADLRASVLLAALKARQGDAAAAMRLAKDLQASYPSHPVPFALEAELLAAAQEFGPAAERYDKALSLWGDDSRLVLRAYRVRDAGSLPGAEKPLTDYLEAHPDSADVRVALGQHYQEQGQSARAIAEYEQIIAAEPAHFVALNNLAWEYFVTGDPRAETVARRAFEQSPDNGEVADTLGWIQVKRGNLEEGLPMLRKAVELTGDNPEVRYHLAAALAAAGEKEEAGRLLEQLLASGTAFSARAEAERLLETL